MAYPKRTHCKKCEVELTYFNCNVVGTGFHSLCKSCQSEYHKEYLKKRKELNPNYNTEKHWRTYGISPEQYNEMLEKQDGKCAICHQESDRKLCIDHNHETDEIRGLLCYKCNSILGLLNDDFQYMWKVYEYLKQTTWDKKTG